MIRRFGVSHMSSSCRLPVLESQGFGIEFASETDTARQALVLISTPSGWREVMCNPGGYWWITPMRSTRQLKPASCGARQRAGRPPSDESRHVTDLVWPRVPTSRHHGVALREREAEPPHGQYSAVVLSCVLRAGH